MNQRPPPPPFAPGRISFSTDFALDQPPPRPPPAAAADFEFAGVGSRPMMAADQLFFKGRILPFKDTPAGAHPHHAAGSRVTTLRDELRAHDDGERPVKGSARWKELLGLRKPHCSSAKKNAGAGGTSGAEAAAESPQFHRS
ncbi:uncharacterized protein LOC109712040 [Ananas comosus]|uniref:Uncharacterized protein LOC109712040 n=1 Tax=Ananas comosus TaxID=4615 RepID=A0A6P5FCA7_ANACO|nr:uncharacterized protein LOC109712040 [Ananas comosus]